MEKKKKKSSRKRDLNQNATREKAARNTGFAAKIRLTSLRTGCSPRENNQASNAMQREMAEEGGEKNGGWRAGLWLKASATVDPRQLSQLPEHTTVIDAKAPRSAGDRGLVDCLGVLVPGKYQFGTKQHTEYEQYDYKRSRYLCVCRQLIQGWAVS